MPSTARLTNALRGHGKALATAGAAAAALVGIGAGTATAATIPAAPLTIPAAAASVHAVSSMAQSAARNYAATLAPASRGHHAAVGHTTATHARHAGAPARHTTAKHGAAAAHHKAAAAPARPYQIYDSVTPSAIPAGHEIATYSDGPYAASRAQLAGRKVLWIDTNTSNPRANALDVEPGDATPPQAATWAAQRLHANPHAIAIIYTMRSEWPATQAAIHTLPAHMQSHVRWWIADPTGVPHIVPGSDATQWYWGHSYDISTATPRF
jgi:hypothetical protein